MPRLATAVTAALGFHVILLMMVLPEYKVVEPEYKGSGFVTVSISPQSHSELVEKAQVEPGPVPAETVNTEIENHVQETMEERLPVNETRKQFLKPRKTKKPVIERTAAEVMNESKDPIENDTADLSPKVKNAPLERSASDVDDAAFSRVETLRYPEPVAKNNTPPSYPPLARKRGWQGTVLLEVNVQSDGVVQSVRIQKGCKYELLNQEALDAVRKWHFSPGYKGGIPVSMKVLVPVHFILQDI